MGYNLTAMARQKGIRRNVTVRPIEPTKANANALASLYLAVLKAWNASDILAGYNTPPKGVSDSLVLDAPSDQTAAIQQAESEVTRLILEFTSGLRSWVLRVERWHEQKWAASVKAATDVEVADILSFGEVSETVDVFIDRNVALVRNVSDQLRGRISDAVYRGYQQRLPVRQVANDISEATGLARKRSLRIASHQNAVLSGALDQQRQDEAGLTAWRWRSSHKKHARAWHAARDGKIYDAATRKQLNPDTTIMDGGETIEAGDEPSQPPNCGCRRAAYLAIMGELGI